MSDDKLFQSRGTTQMFCRQKNLVCDRRPVFECWQNAIVRRRRRWRVGGVPLCTECTAPDL